MSKLIYSEKYNKRRRRLLWFPVWVVPSLIAIFYYRCCRDGAPPPADTAAPAKGLDTTLPDAREKPAKPTDKLAIYKQVQTDSTRAREQAKHDPYYEARYAGARPDSVQSPGLSPGLSPTRAPAALAEQAMAERLSKLNKIVHGGSGRDETAGREERTGGGVGGVGAGGIRYGGIEAVGDETGAGSERLEKLMKALHSRSTPDPEMADLDKMLDKILLIQHPSTKTDSGGSGSLLLPPPSYVEPAKNEVLQQPHAFYGLTDDADTAMKSTLTIPAQAGEDQTLVAGSLVQLRLLSEVVVRGTRIPAGSLVYGIAQLGNERLRIGVHSIRAGNTILPVSLEAYDLDGVAGISMPGSLDREAGKQSADQALGSVGMSSLDPTVAGQATNAGIQAARTLLGKRIRRVQVHLPAGYRLFLVNTGQRGSF
ncbi:MAG: conjugative transposon protein TraM [Puia sp.]|nr:conjugative transposon protein TraM [Puia sp.]